MISNSPPAPQKRVVVLEPAERISPDSTEIKTKFMWIASPPLPAPQKRAVVLEPAERRQVTLLQQLNTIRNQKAATRREQRQRQKAQRAKRADAEEAWRKQYNKCDGKRGAVLVVKRARTAR